MSTAPGPDYRSDEPTWGTSYGQGGDTSIQPAVGGAGAEPMAAATTERQEFGGMRFGACFFGWLTASAMIVLLTLLTGSLGFAFGSNVGIDVTSSVQALQTAGVIGSVALLVIVLLGYFCGGYVAGRMARFSGLKQGLGVWLWAIVATVVVAILGYVTATRISGGTGLGDNPLVPQLPEISTALTGVAILAAVALVGALLGGLAGMSYHRRIDRANLPRR